MVTTNIWKSASTAFSRSAFTDVIKYKDFSQFDWVRSICLQGESVSTYGELLDVVYTNMVKHYRCEYVYKNEIIRQLLRNFRKSDTAVVFNEFRVGDSIADLAIFNGESKAFEIKTEFDSPKRLDKQINDYSRVFEKCYVVIPEKKMYEYGHCLDNNTGILTLDYKKGHLSIDTFREAERNDSIDVAVLIRCLRTKEYEKIVSSYYGKLPDVHSAYMFDACQEQMSAMPIAILRESFITAMKQRRNGLSHLIKVPQTLMQLCTALNLRDKEITSLIELLNTNIA